MMELDEIRGHAERLRKTEVGIGNYATVLNDAFVIIRELTDHVIALKGRIDGRDADGVG